MNNLRYFPRLGSVALTKGYFPDRILYNLACQKSINPPLISSTYHSLALFWGNPDRGNGRQTLLKYQSLPVEQCSRFFSKSATTLGQSDDIFKDDHEMQSFLKEIAADFNTNKDRLRESSSSESDSDGTSSSDSESDSDDERTLHQGHENPQSSVLLDKIEAKENVDFTDSGREGIVFKEPFDNNSGAEKHVAESVLEYDGTSGISSMDDLPAQENADSDSGIIYEEYGFDEEEVYEHETIIEEQPLPISLSRGKSGVYDVEELVTLLKEENGQDIFVVQVPKERSYVDHLVVVTGRSTRHLTAMSSLVQWVYKRKCQRGDPPTVRIEGKNTTDWFAMDLGNIALHLFLHDKRVEYDLETLWTVGPEYDEMMKVQENSDPFAAYLSDSFSLAAPSAIDDVPLSDSHQEQSSVRLPHQNSNSTQTSMENVSGWHPQR